jgi:hypothetical protein
MSSHAEKETWFYRSDSGGEEGPFDLVEMAGLLRTGDIAPETLTRTIDDSAWRPFRERREYEWARDMPAGVIMRHLDKKAERPESPFTPRRLWYLFTFLGGFALYVLGIFLKAYWFGPYVGTSHHDSDTGLAWLLEYLFRHQH